MAEAVGIHELSEGILIKVGIVTKSLVNITTLRCGQRREL
jgi:hypothetical protein